MIVCAAIQQQKAAFCCDIAVEEGYFTRRCTGANDPAPCCTAREKSENVRAFALQNASAACVFVTIRHGKIEREKVCQNGAHIKEGKVQKRI